LVPEAGPIDVLVNNAAVEPVVAFAEESENRIAETIELNVIAPMHLTRLVLPGMLERRRGRVVNIASGAGKKAFPFSAVYGGTKAALIEWTSALGIELEGTGVRTAAVCPGYVTGEGMFARHGLRPLRLLGSATPAQVAAAVVRVLRTGEPELIVNSMPVRPLLAIYQLVPRIAAPVLGWLGVTALQRRRAQVEAAGNAPAP
jgi:short-subunit dehydrogenase